MWQDVISDDAAARLVRQWRAAGIVSAAALRANLIAAARARRWLRAQRRAA
ncbi:MAG: hypothetical protein AB7R89_28295 [Dehalococcoidia bacterium]